MSSNGPHEPGIYNYEDDQISPPWAPIRHAEGYKHNPRLDTSKGGSDNVVQPTQLSPRRSVPSRAIPVAEVQSHHPPPHDGQKLLVEPGSEADSLNVRLQSATLTQPSNPSHPLKRPSEDMQGPNTAYQPETRPAKQPFSPNPRGPHPGPPARHGSFNDSLSHVRPTTAPGIVSHYTNISPVSQETTKATEVYQTPSPKSDGWPHLETRLMKQPATRPITEQQLINEVKGIYAGLVMVERKCVDIINQQNKSTKKLNDQQWKALVALHRTLLQEHHDFFSASQHPSASDNLMKLAIKYAMPARMWRHGIHAFLELLRHRLPDSMEHMLSFIYLAYSMMALLKESVPNFVETWIECLGDLARYRMAIEDNDPRDREIWSNVAKMWYNEAADKSPNVGRIQHHLAVLARPNIVEQLFYYDKALVSIVPFINAQESIMLLFDMFLKNGEAVQARYPPAEFSFVNIFVQLFTRSSPKTCRQMLELFRSSFSGHMDRVGQAFRLQGPMMILAIFAGLLDFGKEDSHLWNLYCQHAEKAESVEKTREPQAQEARAAQAEKYEAIRRGYWENLTFDTPVERLPLTAALYNQETISKSQDVIALCAPLLTEAITLISSRIGDKNQVPTMHTCLASLWDLSYVPKALTLIEQSVPWESIKLFLNTLGRSGVSYTNVEADQFPPSYGGHGKQFPEDFLMRGMMTTRHYYPQGFFTGPLVDEDERNIEWPSHQAPRAERCLWLGLRLAKLGRYFTYDADKKEFETTDFAKSLTTKYVFE